MPNKTACEIYVKSDGRIEFFCKVLQLILIKLVIW